MRRFRLQLIALLAVLTVLLSGAAAAHTHYRCRMSGRVLEACCCAKAAAASAKTRVTEARSPDCCERLVTPARAGATGTLEELGNLPAATITALPVLVSVTPQEVSDERALVCEREPLAIGPPLFIANCSLLT